MSFRVVTEVENFPGILTRSNSSGYSMVRMKHYRTNSKIDASKAFWGITALLYKAGLLSYCCFFFFKATP